ncbi:MAG: aminotransferase class V-fold PLP-dependent enzyme, partial [Pirellulaceae bacterium]|nr:aminotransferase class V-fold PLP-dependent enzyme [Pirellulaceae bacterium]
MITAPIPPWPPLDNEIKESLEKAYLKGEWGKYEGENCSELIEAIGQAFLADFVYLCCSGTFAAELALRALNLEPGDEVILAAYDFPGNFRAIEAVGATPVLVDLAEGHWYLDPKEVEKAVSPRTKGLFVSHLYGDLAPMDEILQITVDKGVAVIEDCCQVPGTKWDGKPIGSFGDLAILSFGGSKPLT